MRSLEIIAHGKPVPQGSKKAVGRSGKGRTILVEANSNLRPWREVVKLAALAAKPDDWTPINGPVWLEADFFFMRPRSHYRTGRNAHLLRDDAPVYKTTTPDESKLVRAVEDSLTDAGIWTDDSRVAVTIARKMFTEKGPGVVLRLREMSPQESLVIHQESQQ